jgi:hypothetical protein
MPASLLTLNTTIPTADEPGAPVVVVYETGDWEIAFAGDVDYIKEGNDSFHSYHSFTDVFVSTMIFFELGDEDDLDVSDGVIYFTISETVQTGQEEEPVLIIFEDDMVEVMERYHAEQMVLSDRTMDIVQNYIPLIELFEEFAKFRARHEDIMFGEGQDDEGDEDEDDY